jgi:hypothetical protein
MDAIILWVERGVGGIHSNHRIDSIPGDDHEIGMVGSTEMDILVISALYCVVGIRWGIELDQHRKSWQMCQVVVDNIEP